MKYLLPSLLLFPALSLALPRDGVVLPVTQSKVSSRFGIRHHPIRKRSIHHDGVDIAAPSGSPVRSVIVGTVVFAANFGSYGNLVVIKHGSTLTSHYGHLSKMAVVVGQPVNPGTVIGWVGTSGQVTGPHLHFEMRRSGHPINPESIIGSIESPISG